jgi:hypothetical protein
MTSYVWKRSRTFRCPAGAAVGATELLTLIAHSEEAISASGRLRCELMAGHAGRHVAFVATVHGGNQWWWLCWEGLLGEKIEAVQINPCNAELPQGRYADDCVLPEGHPGLHSFDLPPASVPP